MSHTVSLLAVSLVNHVQELARQHVAQTQEDRKCATKQRDMMRADKRKAKRRIHSYG